MRDNEFKEWMESLGTMSRRPIGDAVSRCRRIENCNIDLDKEYIRDCGVSLLKKLEYTADDMKAGKPVLQGLDFMPGANYVRGMASLRSAVTKYMEFCSIVPKRED